MTPKRVILFALKVAISAALLWLVLSRVDPANIVARIKSADARWLVPSFAMAPIAVFLSARRWQMLSLGLLGYWECVRYTWIGQFFGSVLPGLVGGDLAKGVALAAKTPRTRVLKLPVSIAFDKLIGLWTLLLLFDVVGVGLLFSMPSLFVGLRGAILVTSVCVAAGLIAAVIVSKAEYARTLGALSLRLPHALLRRFASRAFILIESYGNQRAILAKAAALSLVLHAANAAVYLMVLRSLAVPASFLFAAVFYSLLSVILTLPVSISGIGLRDVFSATVFTAFGYRADAGVAFSWLLLVIVLPSVAAGGFIQLWELGHQGVAGNSVVEHDPFRRSGSDAAG